MSVEHRFVEHWQEDFLCPICMEPMLEAHNIAPCNHKVCNKDAPQIRDSCPFCRLSVEKISKDHVLSNIVCSALVYECAECHETTSHALKDSHTCPPETAAVQNVLHLLKPFCTERLTLSDTEIRDIVSYCVKRGLTHDQTTAELLKENTRNAERTAPAPGNLEPAPAIDEDSEFLELKRFQSSLDATCHVSRLHMKLNRYSNILAMDRTLFPPVEDGSGRPHMYLNANRITMETLVGAPSPPVSFVMSQAPLPAQIGDWWRCVVQHNVVMIVCLVSEHEKPLRMNIYWPPPTKTVNVDSGISVTCLSETESGDIVTRELQVSCFDGTTHAVTHKQYRLWPDHGISEDLKPIASLVSSVDRVVDSVTRESHIIVHCSSGVGRTGTFLGIYGLSRRPRPVPIGEVLEIAKRLRSHRHYTIKTPEQYGMICNWLRMNGQV